jgi:GNAT superfamily N-acetyltransferase
LRSRKYLVEMEPDITIETVRDDPLLIDTISRWYEQEWDTKPQTTARLLKTFQVIAREKGIPVGTAGLYDDVSLLNVYPQFRAYRPWLGMLYVVPGKRLLGIGSLLCSRIEQQARAQNNRKIYLYTFTAEQMYRKLAWIEMKRVVYKGHDTVIMYKDLA